MIGLRDVKVENRPSEFLLKKHENYLRHYTEDDDGADQIMSEFLRMSGMYWIINGLILMNSLEEQSQETKKALEMIKKCQNSDGGFAAALDHDSHILHTLCAIQILTLLDRCNSDHFDIENCVNYIKSLQQKDGSFFGDKWGEVDTRFSLCALATLKLLNRLDSINLDKAVNFVMSCNNQIDGGFGRQPGSESHAAYVYCCVGSLAIADKLDLIDADQLGWWLSERQLPSGGLNGRPEKLPDVCYSWWCLASMKMIDRLHLIDHERLMSFILACQDDDQGGFSDRPGNWVDPFHTMFGVAALSLICHQNYDERRETPSLSEEENQMLRKRLDSMRDLILPVNPVLCMPEQKLQSLKISTKP